MTIIVMDNKRTVVIQEYNEYTLVWDTYGVSDSILESLEFVKSVDVPMRITDEIRDDILYDNKQAKEIYNNRVV